jgi:hypothetical protein
MYTNTHRGVLSHALILLAMLIASCSPSAAATPPTVTPLPSETLAPPTQTPLPTATFTATLIPPTFTPTATHTPEPTATATATPTPTWTATLTPAAGANYSSGLPAAGGNSVWVYLAVLDAGGTKDCKFSAVPVSAGVASSGDTEDDLKAALNSLFAMKSEYYGALYNPLFRSNLRVQSVDVKNSVTVVEMSGTYKPSGDPCDNTIVKAQVWGTIRQFRGVDATNVYLNGIPFGDRVSNDK